MKHKRYMSSADLPYLKDENGKPLCRWCKNPVKPPKRSWCSKECVHEFLIRSSADSLRRAVFERDKGICAGCGADTEKIKRVMRFAQQGYDKLTTGLFEHKGWQDWASYVIQQVFQKVGFNRNQTLWEADHIKEVSSGGETSLDNIQTLCVPCHKAKTKQMHADRKFERTGIRPQPPAQENTVENDLRV